MARATYIYGLKDPNTQEIRYIGKADNPEARYKSHISLRKTDGNTYKKQWISSLLQTGQKPELVILEQIENEQWQDRERWWIQYGQDLEWKLTNIAEGGEGPISVSAKMINTLSNFVEADVVLRLKDMPYDSLFSVTILAGKIGCEFLRKYVNNEQIEECPFDAVRQTIMSELFVYEKQG